MESTPADDATRLLSGAALEVAPQLLGAVVRLGDVAVRLTEVEAYLGVGDDPGSHDHRGRTARNSSMFGPAGTVYVYLSYGIHRCVNLVCGPVVDDEDHLVGAVTVDDVLDHLLPEDWRDQEVAGQ